MYYLYFGDVYAHTYIVYIRCVTYASCERCTCTCTCFSPVVLLTDGMFSLNPAYKQKVPGRCDSLGSMMRGCIRIMGSAHHGGVHCTDDEGYDAHMHDASYDTLAR